MRQLFPCWDKPQLKATFNISIKHPRYISVLSNMPTRSQKHYDSYSDSLRTYFHVTPPMSIFQIAIVMTEYQSIRINENITLWCEYCSKEQSPKFEFVQRIINNITLHLKSEFDEINIPKMDHIAIPNFPQDGISKWGLIFHTEANLIYNETLDTVMRKMEIAHLIAPKIAYQWFSNLLSSVWFHYWWLHDCLATMFGEEAVAKSFNNSEILDFFIIQNQYESLHLDSHFNINPVQITSLLDINSEKFRKLLEKPLKTLGYEEQLMENDFTKCLRQEIVKWACTLQYDECERSALRKLEHHLYNHESRP
ncbi:AMPE aminopeptidase, partial [Acromyrmex insinuator]